MGELNKCRSLFKQAVSRNLDWPEVVFEAWIAFERENGDLLTTYTALERVEGRRKQLAVQLQKADTVVATAAYDAIYTNAGAPAAPNLEMEIDATKVAQESSKKRKKGSNGVVARKKPKPEPTTEDATIESTQGIESAKEEPMTVDDDTARTVYVSKLPLDIADARIRPLFEPVGHYLASGASFAKVSCSLEKFVTSASFGAIQLLLLT